MTYRDAIPGRLVPYEWKRLPEVEPPEQYATESLPDYNARVYRWRVWLDQEPRPDLWYASTPECQNYRKWAGSRG